MMYLVGEIYFNSLKKKPEEIELSVRHNERNTIMIGPLATF